MTNPNPIDATAYLAAHAAELPSPSTKRWVVRRKAVVVAAARSGLLSLQEAAGAKIYRSRSSSPGNT